METVQRDFAPKGVDFYYIYKPLAHPEYNNYVTPFTLEERLMHVAEAKRRLGSSIAWLADDMHNPYHEAMARTPNSELVVDPEGRIAALRSWSDPEALRADLERLVGPVEKRTRVEDLDLPTQPPPPTVAKGVVPRVEIPPTMAGIQVEPVFDGNKAPFYVKLRAEGDESLRSTGQGQMYVGFHLDPLYRVHWNNEAGPVKFSVTPPSGGTVTPADGQGPMLDVPADADPREFLVDVAVSDPSQPLDLDVFYFACDDALTFCIPVNQSYRVYLQRDNHGRTIRTGADNVPTAGRVPPT